MAEGQSSEVPVSRLGIQLEANDASASAKITQLVSALQALKDVSTVSSNLKTVTSSLNDFVKNISNIPNVGKSFNDIASGMRDINNAASGMALEKFSANLSGLNEAASNVSKENAENIKNFGQGLLGMRNFQSFELPEDLSTKITELVDATSKVPADVSNNIKNFGQGLNYLKNIGDLNVDPQQGKNISDLIAGIGRLDDKTGTNLKKISAGLSELSNLGSLQIPPDLSVSLTDLVVSLNQIDKAGIKNVSAIASFGRAMQGLSQMQGFSIPKNLTSDIADLMNILSEVTLDKTAGITSVAIAIKDLSNIGKIDFSRLLSEISLIPDITERLANTDLSKFSAQIQLLSDAIGPLSEEIKTLADAMGQIQGNVSIKFGASSSSRGKGKAKDEDTSGTPARDSFKDLKTQEEFTRSLSEQSKGMSEFSSKLGSEMGKTSSFMESLTKELQDGSSAFSALKSAGVGAIGDINEALSKLEEAHPYIYLIVQALRLAIAAFKLFGSAIKKANEELKAIEKPVIDFAKNKLSELASLLKDLPRRGLNASISGIKSLGSALGSKFTAPFQKATKMVSSFVGGLKRIAYYRFIRSVIKEITDGFSEGTNNLYQYSKLIGTEFAASMDRIATSLNYLKNSLGAMSAPLINALAPAIDYIIDKFVALLNIIGKVMAVLTGKSVYTQAKKQAKEYAEAAGGASSATQKFLLGIDEINKIDSPSGGGGGAGDDYSDMFEEVEIGEDLDWAKQMKDAIDNGDWQGAGKILADKLNDVIDDWDAYDWGKKLGEKINNALNFAYGFLKNFDFENLGRKIADAINGLADTIDWDLLGRTIAAGYNGLFNFLYGFATQLKWGDIGKDIATAINGFIHEFDFKRAAEAISAFVVGIYNLLNNAIINVHWGELGTKLAEFLNNIDWYGIVKGTFSLIANGLNALKDMINGFLFGDGEQDGFHWRSMAQQFKNAFVESWQSVDWAELGRSLGSLIQTGLSFMTELLSDTEFWWNVGYDIASFLINLDWPKLFMGLSHVLVNAINSAIALVSGMTKVFDSHSEEIVDGIADSIRYFVENADTEELAKAINQFISMAIDSAGDLIDQLREDGTLAKLGEKIGEFFEKLDIGTIKADLKGLIGNWIKAQVKDIDVPGIMADVGWDIVSGLVQGVINKYSELGPSGIFGMIAQGIMNWIYDFFGIASPSKLMRDEVGVNLILGLLEGIEQTWSSITGFFSGAFSGVQKAFDVGWGAVEAVTEDGLGGLWKYISGGWKDNTKDTKKELGTYTNTVKSSLDDTRAATETSMSEIQTAMSTYWSKSQTDASLAVDGIKTNTENSFNQMQKSIDTTLKLLNTDVSNNFTAIKETSVSSTESLRTETEGKFSEMQKNLKTTTDNIKKETTDNFESMKTDTVRISGETSTSSESEFKKMKDLLKTVWESLKALANESAVAVKDAFNTEWDKTNRDANSKWDTIKSNLSRKWQDLKSAAKSALDGLGSWISKQLSGQDAQIANQAKKYSSGSGYIPTSSLRTTGYALEPMALDLGFAEPMVAADTGAATAAVGDAVAGVGSAVGASVSPMSVESPIGVSLRASVSPVDSRAVSREYSNEVKDFQSFATDMFKTFSNEIKDNTYLIEDAMKNVAKTIEESIQNAFPDGITIPVEAKMESDFSMYRYNATADVGEQEEQRSVMMERNVQYDMTDRMYSSIRESNDNIVNVVYAAAQQIVTAINENGGDLYLDGQVLGRQTTSIQNRQNRMYGKTLQNV